MIPAPTFALFMLAALALLLVPGPAVLYIITRSVEQGRLAGAVSAAGLGLGNLIQAVAASAGLSALVLSSPLAFNVVKFAGAGYLVYAGLRKVLAKAKPHTSTERPARRLRQVFAEGVVINTFNPKVALFFLAFLPQFVNLEAGSPAAQIFILAASFAALGVVTDSLYALAAGSASGALRSSAFFPHFERYVSGAVFIALGISAAFTAAAA
jgi:threonine/homoserine/homoserine lactone efflux protein